jgi:polyhydroxyalkanoate synthase subunit PhaC
MYAALHPEKVKNVITVVTPGDFSADDTLLSLWTKNTNVEALLDAFGNAVESREKRFYLFGPTV